MDDITKEATIAVGVILLCTSLLILGINHTVAIGKIAKIENLRMIVNELGLDIRTEDILGKVAEVNMELSAYKAYNKIPIAQYWVSDKLANLDFIQIPTQKD